MAKKAALDNHSHPHSSQPPLAHDQADLDLQDHHQRDYYTDDDDDEEEDYAATAPARPANRLPHQHYIHDPASTSSPSTSTKRKNKKKRRSTSAQQNRFPDPTALITSAMGQMPPLPLPTPQSMSGAALRTVRGGARQDRIWNTSTQEERERIKEFWLSLTEDERKSLLKIEKEAVLRKMKEQQKHSCSCTVCGRKRTAIEEELEVLYDAYYEELEQYAHQKDDPTDGMLPPPRALPRRLPSHPGMPLPLDPGNSHHRTSRMHETIDDQDDDLSQGEEEDEDDDDDDDDDAEEEDDDEYSEDEEDGYSEDEENGPEDRLPRGLGNDFFQFGNSLTVKGRQYLQEMLTYWLGRLNCASGGILTVADDLLKNDGKKFIEMMEQLAERRMQREQEAEYAASQPAHSYPNNSHDPPLEDDDYDEEDEEEYDSQEEYDEEEEEDEMVPFACPSITKGLHLLTQTIGGYD